jgi:hypothetical protein
VSGAGTLADLSKRQWNHDVNAVFSNGSYDNPLVSGTMWFDANSNGIRDQGEQTGMYADYGDVWGDNSEWDFDPRSVMQLRKLDGTVIWEVGTRGPKAQYQVFSPESCICFLRFGTFKRAAIHFAPTGAGTDVATDSDFITRGQTDGWVHTAETDPQLLEFGRVFDLGYQRDAVWPPQGWSVIGLREVSGSVWLDDNGNGVRDGGERPAAGVRLAYRFADYRDAATELKPIVATFTTGAEGSFHFALDSGQGMNMGWVSIDPSSIPAGRKLSPMTRAPDWNDGRDATYSAIEPTWNESYPIGFWAPVGGVGIGLAPA